MGDHGLNHYRSNITFTLLQISSNIMVFNGGSWHVELPLSCHWSKVKKIQCIQSNAWTSAMNNARTFRAIPLQWVPDSVSNSYNTDGAQAQLPWTSSDVRDSGQWVGHPRERPTWVHRRVTFEKRLHLTGWCPSCILRSWTMVSIDP